MAESGLKRLSSTGVPDVRCQVGIPIRSASSLQPDQQDQTRDARATVARVRFGVPTDANGLVIGRWRVDFFDCVDIWPNAICSCLFPCISLGQIAARMGFCRCGSITIMYGLSILAMYFCFAMSYVERTIPTKEEQSHYRTYYDQYLRIELNTTYLALALVPFAASVTLVIVIRRRIRVLLSIPGSTAEDCLFTCLCMPCSIAQLATHTSSYEAGRTSCCPLPTLPGYNQSAAREQPQAVVEDPAHPSDVI